MGVNARVFDLIVQHCKQGGKALSAGYPDMLVPLENLMNGLGGQAITIPKDEASDTIINMHGLAGKLKYAPDARAVFKALGYDLTVIDIYQERGCERIVDLNYPAEIGEYDLVVDHGTIEHCFNIAQAAINLASAVKVGGHIVQHLPMSMFNHGLYNLNPTWFWSFYPKNGFEILHMEGFAYPNQIGELPKHDLFTVTAQNMLITVVAKRVEKKPISYQMQQKYAAEVA